MPIQNDSVAVKEMIEDEEITNEGEEIRERRVDDIEITRADTVVEEEQ